MCEFKNLDTFIPSTTNEKEIGKAHSVGLTDSRAAEQPGKGHRNSPASQVARF
jgi:hypothetical protein